MNNVQFTYVGDINSNQVNRCSYPGSGDKQLFRTNIQSSGGPKPHNMTQHEEMQRKVVHLMKNQAAYNNVSSKNDKKYHLSNRMAYNSQ